MTFEERFNEIVGKDFNDYYKTFYPKLIWHVQNIIQDQDDAHDIADMAFMKSLTAIESYNPKYAFSTWLFTIATKMSMQYLKDRRRLVSMDQEIGEDGTTFAERLPEEDDTTAEEQERARMKAEVMMTYIEQLDPRYQRVIKMREIEHMAYQDIADALDMNLSTVKNHIRSGRQILMKKVRKEFLEIEENY